MPIYEYECAKCEKVAEVWQSITGAGDVKCPECFETMKRIISKSSFQLKGTGWAKHGYTK